MNTSTVTPPIDHLKYVVVVRSTKRSREKDAILKLNQKLRKINE